MRKTIRCGACGGSAQEGGREWEQERVAGISFRVSVPTIACPRCGETYVPADALLGKELRIADRVLRGPMRGDAFRYARKALGLRGADLAEILNVDAATVSRWENKGSVDRAAWLLLGAFVREKLAQGTLDLESLRKEGAAPDAEQELSV